MDSDAAAYIAAVETADGTALPASIKNAIDAFVVGAKADGFWTAIKAACFLAGPRTLAGAMVPLVGTAPTNIGGNFVAGDYDQLTGLKGNGSTKVLDTNRNNNADPQDSVHQSVWISSRQTGTSGAYMGSGAFNSTGGTHFICDLGNNWIAFRNRAIADVFGNSFRSHSPATSVAFIGHSRSASSGFISRLGGANQANTILSDTPFNGNNYVFARNASGVNAPSNARIAWYSIGESLDLALLDSRLTTYMAAIANSASSAAAVHFFTFGF